MRETGPPRFVVAPSIDVLVTLVASGLRELGQVRTVAVAGGSVVPMFVTLLDEFFRVTPNVRLTWVDERCVPAQDSASNRGETERLLGRSIGRFSEVIPLYDEDDGATFEERLAASRARIRARVFPSLDLCLLGMGDDGHIASLFPGHPWGSSQPDVLWVRHSPKPPSDRLSLSLSALCSCPAKLLIATGAGKLAALRRLRDGDGSLPGTHLPGLVVYTDQPVEGTNRS